MKQSGGHVSVYSRPGEGTTFRLFLPRDDQPPTPVLELPSRHALVGGNETILLVEDNARLLHVVSRQLSEAGYRVSQAENADAALVILHAAEPIDLLMTDVVMPGELDGFDLAHAARALRPALKVLLTSGFPDARGVTRDDQAPTGRLLGKPYRKQELIRAVRAALDDIRLPQSFAC